MLSHVQSPGAEPLRLRVSLQSLGANNRLTGGVSSGEDELVAKVS